MSQNPYVLPDYDGLKLADIKNVRFGFHAVELNRSTGTHSACRRWRVSGRVQTWARASNAHRVRVPVKFGLYANDAVTEGDVGRLDMYAFQHSDTNQCPFCGSRYF